MVNFVLCRLRLRVLPKEEGVCLLGGAPSSVLPLKSGGKKKRGGELILPGVGGGVT